MANDVLTWATIIVVLALQFYLVKRPQQWLGLVLPAGCFLLSIVRTVLLVQSGFVLENLLFTVLFGLFSCNVMTFLCLIVYWKREESVGSKIVAVIIGALACVFIFVLCSTIAAVNLIMDDLSENKIGQWYYAPIDETSVESLPVRLEDLQEEQLSYRHVSATETETELLRHSKYVESQADSLSSPQKIMTLQYEVWECDEERVLNREETAMQKKYDTSSAASYDYGAEKAYWLGDNLMIRYKDALVIVYDSSTKALLDSQAASTVFGAQFGSE